MAPSLLSPAIPHQALNVYAVRPKDRDPTYV